MLCFNLAIPLLMFVLSVHDMVLACNEEAIDEADDNGLMLVNKMLQQRTVNLFNFEYRIDYMLK